jgi:CRISPR-associated protein Cse2 (CRISPR_cse2)
MNDEIDFDAPDPGSDQPSEKKSRLESIATELWRLNEAQATGELAALRRMDSHSAPPAGFYRLMARAGATEMGADAVRRWARAVAIMAQRPDALRASGLGETLKAIGVSEQRLDMLLYSRGPALHDLARRTAVRVARSHEFLPYRDLCQLVLFEADRETEDVRIRVAQSYLRAKSDADSPSPAPTA